MRPHHGIITGDGYRISEIIIGCRIAGNELGILQSPNFKNIGGAGTAAPVIVTVRPHHGIITGDGYRISEIIICGRIVGNELGLLTPGGAVADKDIGGAGVVAPVIVLARPHHGLFPVYGSILS